MTAVAVVVGTETTGTATRQEEPDDQPKGASELTPRPPKQPRPQPTAGAAQRATVADSESADKGDRAYVWYDGDRTIKVWLRDDLIVQPTSENTADDIVVSTSGEWTIVQRQPSHGSDALPVFRTSSDTLMTLPGGVILKFDGSWDRARIDAFFADHGVSVGSVVAQSFAANAFLVETEPGFPTLELANQLAVQDGVEISSPNWRRETELR